MRTRRMGRTCAALALLMGATVVPSCGGPASLTQVANDLQTALMAMPGVTDAWVYHDESYTDGVTFNVAVDVPTATRSQLIAVADRISATRITTIANYTENIELWVTPGKPVTIRRQSNLDPVQMADDAERLRVIAADADGRIDWFRDEAGAVNQLSVTEGQTPGADLLDAVRRNAGDTNLTLSVSPASPSPRTPRMSVAFPLSTQRRTSVEHFLDSVPVDVFGVRIDNDGVRALQVMVPADPAVAERELSTVIDASKAVAAGPMLLAWYVPSTVGGVPLFGGVVQVGDCSASATQIQQTSRQTSHEETSTLQARLQAKIDTCTAPDPIGTEAAQPPTKTLPLTATTPLVQRHPPLGVGPTDVTTVAGHPSPVSAGGAPSGKSPAMPARLPSPVRSRATAPLPAAAQVPTGPPPGGDEASAASGPRHSPAPPHRSTSRTARSGR